MHVLRRLTAATFILLAPHVAIASIVSGARGRAFDAYLTRLEAYGFSGAVLVAHGDSVVIEKDYGAADRARNLAVDEHTLFNLASLTKPITASLILRLQDDGRLRLTDTLGSLLDGVPEDKRAITVAQLLTHTSGLPRDALRRNRDIPRDEALRLILAAKLRGRPGASFAYSNAGYQLLALIAEHVTGRSYGALLRQIVFRPSGMHESLLVRDPVPDGSVVAHGYNEWRGLGTWRQWHDGWRSGSGDVVSSLDDTWRWFRALRGGRIIPPDATARMFASHATARDGGYGYGWFTARTSEGDSLIYHGGDNAGYHTLLRWYVGRDLVVIVFTNLELYDESGGGLGLHKRVIANALARLAQGGSVATPPEPHPLPARELERWTGVHEPADGAAGTYLVSVEDGRLVIAADGQGAVDGLLGVTDESVLGRLADADRKSRVLLDAIANGDSSAIRTVLGKDTAFFLPGFRGDREHLTRANGALVSSEVLGTRPLPWDPALLRTVCRLHFQKTTVDYQFTWDGASLYETLSELGTPHAVIMPLVPVGDGEFAVWDLVARRGARLRAVNGTRRWRATAIQ